MVDITKSTKKKKKKKKKHDHDQMFKVLDRYTIKGIKVSCIEKSLYLNNRENVDL